MGKEISNQRLLQILDNLFAWAADHDQEFYECFIEASGISSHELDVISGNITVYDDDE